MNASIDLSDLDTADVAWLNDDDASLFSLAPTQGVAVAQQHGNGRTCGAGGSCCFGRPSTPWFCGLCH